MEHKDFTMFGPVEFLNNRSKQDFDFGFICGRKGTEKAAAVWERGGGNFPSLALSMIFPSRASGHESRRSRHL